MAEASKYLYWLGVILAIIAAFLPFVGDQATVATWMEWIILIEVIIGIIVGFMNITAKEINTLFMGGMAFLLSYPAFANFTAGLTQLTTIWTIINGFLTAMAAMVAPAVVLVALKVLPEIMKD